MHAKKLTEATQRLEYLYWDCHRNGGPDLEVLAILRLCEEAATDGEPSDDETVYMDEHPPAA